MLVRWGSTRDLAYYNIAVTIAGLLVLVPASIAQPLMPSFVHLLSSSQNERLERLYNNILAAIVISIFPMALIICVSAKPFLNLWAGVEFGRASVLPLYILVAGHILRAASFVPNTLLIAQGRIDVTPRYQAIELLPYCLIMFLLVSRFGIVGAAMAWTLRAAVECLLLFLAVGRITHIRQRLFPKKFGNFLLALAVLTGPVFLTWIVLPIPSIIILAAILALIAYAAVVLMRLATSEERAWLVDSAKKLWR